MRRLIAIALVLAAAVAAYLFWASDERQIRRLLDGVADTVSQEDGAGGVMGLAEVAGLTSYLAPGVMFEPGPPFQPISGAQEVVSTVGRVRATVPVFIVAFVDAQVSVAGGSSATVHATATLTMRDRDGAASLDAREIVIQLEKREGRWMITAGRAVRVLEPVA